MSAPTAAVGASWVADKVVPPAGFDSHPGKRRPVGRPPLPGTANGAEKSPGRGRDRRRREA
jgi:hypothetical protein